jgi:hypothetical protein
VEAEDARLNNPHGSRLISRADSCTCRAEKRQTLGRKDAPGGRARGRGGTNMSQPRMWSCLLGLCCHGTTILPVLTWLGFGLRRAERTREPRGLAAGHGCCCRRSASDLRQADDVSFVFPLYSCSYAVSAGSVLGI